MNSKDLLALDGLKWNPFSPELPREGRLRTPKIEQFAWRVEQLVQEGGFALITGESGTGKSVALRRVAGRLSALRDVSGGVSERPQSRTADFDRELGDIVAVKLKPHNRWGGFNALRERWRTHVASSRIRPVLLVDEAQEMSVEVLSELRIRSSADCDAPSLLTVVLSGDGRLLDRLRPEDLIPSGTRIRTRLVTEPAARAELLELLRHALAQAGNAALMTAALMETLVDHSAGNTRLLMILGAELLAYGLAHEVAPLDERGYLEVVQPRSSRPAPKKKGEVERCPRVRIQRDGIGTRRRCRSCVWGRSPTTTRARVGWWRDSGAPRVGVSSAAPPRAPRPGWGWTWPTRWPRARPAWAPTPCPHRGRPGSPWPKMRCRWCGNGSRGWPGIAGSTWPASRCT
jgi:general secretion pathway protein A